MHQMQNCLTVSGRGKATTVCICTVQLIYDEDRGSTDLRARPHTWGVSQNSGITCRRQVYPDADPNFFMFSENLFEVAERGGVGYKRGSGFPLHFVKAFSERPSDVPHFVYSTRRMW